jgi:hypothetical protein
MGHDTEYPDEPYDFHLHPHAEMITMEDNRVQAHDTDGQNEIQPCQTVGGGVQTPPSRCRK